MKTRIGLAALWLLSLGLAGCGGDEGRDVWAERITSEDQLLRGRTARGKLGDYRIFNSSVGFVIQDVGLASGYRRYGGGVADAASSTRVVAKFHGRTRNRSSRTSA